MAWMRSGSPEAYSITGPCPDNTAENKSRLDLKLLMITSAVGYLASGLAMCDWRTIVEGKDQIDNDYYLLNVAPNQNQNKVQFCTKLVSQLVLDNEAVIFARGSGLYVADSWSYEPHGTGMDWYRNVSVDGTSETTDFQASDIMHLQLDCEGVTPLLNQLATEYEDIIEVAAEGYKRQTADKGIIQQDSLARGVKESQELQEARIKRKFKEFYGPQSAAIILTKGYTYVPQGSSARNTSELNDVANLTDEWAERVGMALRVPPVLLKGNAENTSHARADLITYGISPIARQIEAEYNAKKVTRRNYLNGTRLLIDPTPIEMADLSSRATYGDKLLGSGVSINELRRMRLEPLLTEPGADTHFVTLNYGQLGAQDGTATQKED